MPVDYDPFGANASDAQAAQAEPQAPQNLQDALQAAQTATPKLVPVDHDPFAGQAAPPSVSSDMATGLNSGLTKGAIGVLGSPGDLADIGGNAFEYGAQKLLKAFGYHPPGGDQLMDRPYSQIAAENKNLSSGTNYAPRSQDIEQALTNATGVELPDAQTVPGQYAETIGKFIPATLGLGGSTFANVVKMGIVPAVTSETAGQLTKGTEAEPYARLAAALVSPAAVSAGRYAITPNTLSPERAALVRTLADEGVNLTAGQTTGNKALRWAESVTGDLPFSNNAASIDELQRQQFTTAAMSRAGSNASLATPEAMAQAKGDLGATYDDLSARNTLNVDPELQASLDKVSENYQNSTLPSQARPVVANTLSDIYDLAHPQAIDGTPQVASMRTPVLGPDGQVVRYNFAPGQNAIPSQAGPVSGSIPGQTYQDIRSRLTKQSKSFELNDPQTAEALRGIRNSLDDAMTRSISPDDATAWADTNRKYANYKVLEKAATGAGENSAQGYISPSQLRNATVAQNRAAYAVGNGDFADLARAGEAIMKPLPNSGTAPRQGVMNLVHALSGGGGFAAGGPMGAMLGASMPSMAGNALMSRPMQAYLKNQLLPASQNSRNALIDQLMLSAGRSQN